MAEKERFGEISDPARNQESAPENVRLQEGSNIANREWLGLRELTYYANISERTIRSWIYSPSDPLPATKVGGKVLIRKTDFNKYLERHRVRPLHTTDIDGLVRSVLSQPPEGR